MATTTVTRTARRTGYVIAVLVDAGLLLAVNVWPGWSVLPFLTPEFRQVLGLVNLTLLVGCIVNLVYLAVDGRAVRAAGDAVTTAVGLAAAVLMLRVFPFAFGPGFEWALVVRVLLVLGVVGSAIGLVVALVALVRALLAREPLRRP